MHIIDRERVVKRGFMMLHLLAEISASDGAAIMVDEFSGKMKGCCDGRARGKSCDV
jgi:hypothetical protein